MATQFHPYVLYNNSSIIDSYSTPKSPPPEKIITKIHPQTIGMYESTKKLSFAPNINKETDILKKEAEFYEFLQNPISKRFLGYYIPGDDYRPQFINETVDNKNVVEVKAVVDGMINSLNKLNKTLYSQKHLPDETISEKSFGDIVYFNSVHTLATFVNIQEIHKTSDSVIYLVENRFDGCYYILKSALIHVPWNNSDTLTFPNLYKLREAQILSTTIHDNIVRFQSVWFEQQSIFLQLEYMVGSTLHYMWYGRFYINRNSMFADLNESDVKMSVESAKKLIKNMASALNYLHNDLKLVHNHINSLHIFAAYSGILKSNCTRYINTKKRHVIKSVMESEGEDVIFKLFDFGRSYAIEEPPIPRRSLKLSFLNDIKDDPFYKDILSLGIVLAEAFLSREDFYDFDFLNDTINVVHLSPDAELNLVISKMLLCYDMKELNAKSLYEMVEHW